MNEEDAMADLLAVVTSGRADPFVDVAMADAPLALKEELRSVREAVAALALDLPAAPEAPPALRERILNVLVQRSAPPRRALLVIDMQNDHLSPGRPLEVPRARDIVPAIASRLDAAHRDGTPVVYVLDEHDPKDSDLDAWGAHNIKGSSGAEVWSPLSPLPGDRIVRKPTYSAFSRSDLGQVLAELRVDTLVLTGCLTELGMLATATDALQRGYRIEVPPDAQAGATALNEQFALGILSVLVPYGPAREELIGWLAEDGAPSL